MRGFLGRIPVTRQEHLGRSRVTDRPLEKPGATVTGYDADLDEARRELCALSGDANIAQAGDVVTQPDGVPVDCGDHWYLEVVNRADDPLHTSTVVGACRVRLLQWTYPCALLDRFQVAAGTERATGTRQDTRRDTTIVGDRLQRADEILAVLMAADGVQRRLVVHAKNGNAAAALNVYKISQFIDSYNSRMRILRKNTVSA